MAIKVDPAHAETVALFSLAASSGTEPFAGQQVLEVGCGDGRLTWRYADRAAAVQAIDPNPEKIRRAREEIPAGLADRVGFSATDIESYRAPHRFDLIIFSWSL